MKTLRPLAFGCFLLAATTTLTTPLRAQTVSPYPAPTIITTAPYTISKPGYYQLGADLTYTSSGNIININVGNVTLDFAGHYISGPSSGTNSTVGVNIGNRGNILIRNGTIAYCSLGIDFYGASSGTNNCINNTVDNMLITRCTNTALQMAYCDGATITNNRVTFTAGNTQSNFYVCGIYLLGNGGEISKNTVNTVTGAGTNSAYGIIGDSGKVADNAVSNVTAPSAKDAIGINSADFAIGNVIKNCRIGISGADKYKDNLTNTCATPFSGGTAVGTNN